MKKFLLSLAVAALGMMSASAANWYISGAFQGWSHCNPSYMLTETSSGVYSITLNTNLSGEFLIVQGEDNTPDWDNKIGGVNNMVADKEYTYVPGGNNFSVSGVINCSSVEINTNNQSIIIKGTAGTNDYETVYLVGDFGSGWNENAVDHPMTLKSGTNNVWTATYNLTAEISYFKMKAGSYIYGTGGDDIAVNLGEKYTAPQTGNAFSIGAGNYTFTFVLDKNADTGELTVTAASGSDTPVDPNPGTGEYPAVLYMIGNVDGYAWSTSQGVSADNENGKYTFSNVTIDEAGNGVGYFAFCTVLSTSPNDWDTVNTGDRYGAPAADTPLALGESATIQLYAKDISASGSQSWMINAGQYDIVADLVSMKVSVYAAGTGVDTIVAADGEAVYYNLQGQKVANPDKGIYVKVLNGKAVKVVK